jgi:hypothetical protein
MKTKFILPILVVTFISSVSTVLAQTTTPKNIRNQVRQENRQDVKATGTQIREEKRLSLSEEKQKRIQSFYSAIKNGLEKRHTSLLKIKDKIQARIDKNPMKKNVDAAKTEIAKFVAAEAQYQTDLAALETKFNELKSSTKASELIKGLKDSVNLVREDLNSIKKVLNTTVKTLAQAQKLEVNKTE